MKLPIACGFVMPYTHSYNLKTEAATARNGHRSLTDTTVVAAVAAHTILDGFTKRRKLSTRSLRRFPFAEVLL